MDFERMVAIFHDIFVPSLPRLAPGDDGSTRRALEALYGPGCREAGDDIRVLDLGCGNGAQTLCLAETLAGRITAIDNYQPYLTELDRRAEARGVADRVETRCADMNTLDLEGETVDLVWAEGSAYNTGIPEALTAWRSHLEPGGAVGFTELTWLEDGAPDEVREFFAREYPPMTDVAANLATIEACGYDLVDRFTVPESSWLTNYHEPLSTRLAEYDPAGDEDKQTIFDMCRTEVEIYRKYSRWYGYEFFMLRKRD